jgi:hypothetical protein
LKPRFFIADQFGADARWVDPLLLMEPALRIDMDARVLLGVFITG